MMTCERVARSFYMSCLLMRRWKGVEQEPCEGEQNAEKCCEEKAFAPGQQKTQSAEGAT